MRKLNEREIQLIAGGDSATTQAKTLHPINVNANSSPSNTPLYVGCIASIGAAVVSEGAAASFAAAGAYATCVPAAQAAGVAATRTPPTATDCNTGHSLNSRICAR